jgi:TetR/AcrR family transcriptional regulator, tetracycline repressor protein
MTRTGSPLTREHILQTALRIMDEQGLDGLSMRKLAAELGVEAMSLYNHVKDKRDLLDGLTDLALASLPSPDSSLPWDTRLEALAQGLYEALLRHPALALVLSAEQGFPRDIHVLRAMDSAIAALGEAGLEPTQRVNAYRGLLALILGSVFAHTQGLSKTRAQAQADWDQAGSRTWEAATLPHLAGLAPAFTQTYAEDDFQFMLKAYLSYLRGLG